MLQRLTDWLKADPARTLHVIYVTLVVVLVVVLYWMHHVHVNESAELHAQVELANQESLRIAHAADQAAAERTKQEATGAAVAASAAASASIRTSTQLKADQDAQAAKLKPVSSWDELNQMAGVK